jgi:hypothetical protein
VSGDEPGVVPYLDGFSGYAETFGHLGQGEHAGVAEPLFAAASPVFVADVADDVPVEGAAFAAGQAAVVEMRAIWAWVWWSRSSSMAVMAAAGLGWNAHALNAPGKFLVSAPEDATPRRAGRTSSLMTMWPAPPTAMPAAAPHLTTCPAPRSTTTRQPNRRRGTSGTPTATWASPAAPEPIPTTTPEGALWAALCAAPEDGADIGDLMRANGMGRSTLYRDLAQLAQAGRAIQVGWGRWRAIIPEQAHDE